MPGRSATALQVKGGTYSGVFRASLPWSFKENFDFAVFVIKKLDQIHRLEKKMPKTDTLDALDNAMTTILTTNKL